MKVVILAGGLGTRISEYTNLFQNQWFKVLGKPIINENNEHFVKLWP